MAMNFEKNIESNIDSKSPEELVLKTKKKEKVFGVVKSDTKQNKKTVLLYIDDELLNNLDKYCVRAGYNRNTIINLMITHCLDNAVIYDKEPGQKG